MVELRSLIEQIPTIEVEIELIWSRSLIKKVLEGYTLPKLLCYPSLEIVEESSSSDVLVTRIINFLEFDLPWCLAYFIPPKPGINKITKWDLMICLPEVKNFVEFRIQHSSDLSNKAVFLKTLFLTILILPHTLINRIHMLDVNVELGAVYNKLIDWDLLLKRCLHVCINAFSF